MPTVHQRHGQTDGRLTIAIPRWHYVHRAIKTRNDGQHYIRPLCPSLVTFHLLSVFSSCSIFCGHISTRFRNCAAIPPFSYRAFHAWALWIKSFTFNLDFKMVTRVARTLGGKCTHCLNLLRPSVRELFTQTDQPEAIVDLVTLTF